MSNRAFDIEKRSFEIIDAEVGKHDYDELQWTIVRRAVHATTDFEFATGNGRIIFHPSAIESAFEGIKNKCQIITDVDMVLAGLNKKSISDLGLNAACYISDSTLGAEARKLGLTRSQMALRRAANEIDGGIVLIGNAPTALYELVHMIKDEGISPSLVVGIPVGFVSAAEAKQELYKLSAPFITNAGRKGGSPVVSSIMNAIMLLYQKKQSSV